MLNQRPCGSLTHHVRSDNVHQQQFVPKGSEDHAVPAKKDCTEMEIVVSKKVSHVTQ